jgi:hypothetical protein
MTREEISIKFNLNEMFELLPAEVIYKKKTFFRMDEVYELVIRKAKCFNTWTIEYYNERMVRTYFQVQSKSLNHAVSEMLHQLSEQNFIQL